MRMNARAQSIDHRLLLAQRGWMRRLAAELVSDTHAGEDVVQETFRIALG